MQHCGHCGANRLLPLTFTLPTREETDDGWQPRVGRPVVKCLECGRRLTASEVARSRATSGVTAQG